MTTWQNFLEQKSRCLAGYEVVPGKKPFSKGSCKKKSFKEFVDLREESEKPFNDFDAKKNHPEGGLSRSEAKRQGVKAGIDTKKEAEKKGGWDKLSDKTQARRKSFCSRMKGMRDKNTSKETAKDPDSKINASLRVWNC